jgi:hypothetical protein
MSVFAARGFRAVSTLGIDESKTGSASRFDGVADDDYFARVLQTSITPATAMIDLDGRRVNFVEKFVDRFQGRNTFREIRGRRFPRSNLRPESGSALSSAGSAHTKL